MANLLKNYHPADLSLWQGRLDANLNEYYYQIIKPLDLNNSISLTPGLALLGFACDEGVRRNLGRPGAIQGSQLIKQCLAKLPLHKEIKIYDAGTISCSDTDLETAQYNLGFAVTKLLANGFMPIVLGGGHETAWGHYQGLEPAIEAKSLAIVNFDAHFDLRNLLIGNKGSSGTPFKQIAQARAQKNLPFDYYCLGVQPNSNSQSLFITAKDLNTHYLLAEKFYHPENPACSTLIKKIINTHDVIYLSICLDVFSASTAPGVSAPQPLDFFS